MSVTQKQIAERLGVSQSLVAHALKGYPQIAEETRRRVEEVAREMGYGANSNGAARLLRAQREGGRHRTHTIAVLSGDVFEGAPLNELRFYQPILRGMEAEARRREMDLSFCSVQPDRLPRVVTAGAVDAVIGLYNAPWVRAKITKTPPYPLLQIGDGAPTDWAIRPDDRTGIYLSTKHLIELGHKSIAYLGDFIGSWTEDVSYRSRLDGYLQALEESGIGVRNNLVESHIGAPTFDAGAAGAAHILEQCCDVTAIVCFNDSSALGAVAELRKRGLRVPEDISVVGFDDVVPVHGEPLLTTIHFDRFEMGRRAVEAVCQAVDYLHGDSETLLPGGHELLPVHLVKRATSVGPR